MDLFEKFGVQIDILEVDATMARSFLGKNKEHAPGVAGTNRKPTQKEMQKWCDDMVAGRWRLTHQGIAFDEDGWLIDGQHRLKALIMADAKKPGVTIFVMVSGGFERTKAFEVIDIGRRRSLADLLSTHGYQNGKLMQTAAKLHFCYHNVPYENIHTWSRAVPNWNGITMPQWIKDHPTIITATEFVADMKSLRTIGNSAAFVAGYSLCAEIRPDINIDAFMHAIADGAGEGWDVGKAEYELRETLRTRAKSQKGAERVTQLGLFILAFNAYAAKRYVKKLNFVGTQFPIIAGKAETLDVNL